MIRSAALALILMVGWALAHDASAQGLVTGRVTDASTDLPLPGATVQVAERPAGAVTNTEGRFSLAISQLPTTLTIRFIGYRSASITLELVPSEPLAIALKPDVLAMGELVVSGEDPAYPIVRRALAAKQGWIDSVRTSYAEAYSRFTLLRELEPVRMEESISAVWWMAGGGTREVVRALRTRPARHEEFRFVGPLVIPNLYEDNVILDGARFVGPLHPDATERYDLKLTGRRVRDGRTIFDVAFTPAGATETGFVGLMAIEDSTYDVLEIHARPSADRVGPPPVLERSVQVSQTFARIGGGMVPVSFSADGWVRFGVPGASYPTARFRQVSGLSLFATRVPVPDTLFATDRQRFESPGLGQEGWLFEWNPGMVPMTEQETAQLGTIAAKPPLSTIFRPEGLLRQYLAVQVVTPPPVPADDRPMELFRPWVWYNRVDGWQVGLQPSVPLGPDWTFRPKLGYAVAREGVPWSVSWTRDPVAGLRIETTADHLSAITGEAVSLDRFLLGLATYAGFDDYYDYFDRKRIFGRIGWAFEDLPVHVDVIASAERHRSATKEEFYTGWLQRNDQRPNPPIADGGLTSLAFEVGTGDQSLPGTRGAFYAGSRVEMARSDWPGSDFDYVRWSGAFALRVPTLLRRRADPATLRIDVFAGLGTDGIPIQREGFLDTAVGVLAPGAGFRVPRGRMPLSKRWLALFWQHDFGSLFADWLHLGERAERWGVFGGHGQAWGDPIGWRHEVGIFVRNVIRLPIRVNVATPTGFWAPHVTLMVETSRQK